MQFLSLRNRVRHGKGLYSRTCEARKACRSTRQELFWCKQPCRLDFVEGRKKIGSLFVMFDTYAKGGVSIKEGPIQTPMYDDPSYRQHRALPPKNGAQCFLQAPTLLR